MKLKLQRTIILLAMLVGFSLHGIAQPRNAREYLREADVFALGGLDGLAVSVSMGSHMKAKFDQKAAEEYFAEQISRMLREEGGLRVFKAGDLPSESERVGFLYCMVSFDLAGDVTMRDAIMTVSFEVSADMRNPRTGKLYPMTVWRKQKAGYIRGEPKLPTEEIDSLTRLLALEFQRANK